MNVLVSLAGIYPFHPLVGYLTEIYRHIITLNVDAYFRLTRAVLPYIQTAGYGRITNTSSTTVIDLEPGLFAYIASKAAVVRLTLYRALKAG
jgi:NAD(P)-dependent dehydrogenase (short-subunit alcohol dehydrogenase family)